MQLLTLEVDGKDYKLESIGFLIRVLCETELKDRKRTIFLEIVNSARALPPEAAEKMLVAAYKEYADTSIVTPQELDLWMVSASGVVFQFREWIKRGTPAITDEEIMTVYSKLNNHQWKQINEYMEQMTNPVQPANGEQDRKS